MRKLGYSAKTPFPEKDSLKRKSMKKLSTDSLIIKCYKKDVVLIFKSPKLPIHKLRRYKRSKIKRFSFLSQRRLRLFSRNTSHIWKIFITLTYPENFPQNGKLVKKHLDTFLKRLSRYSQTIKYLWVIEFQDRGAPHYHILTNEKVDKNWLSQNWYEVVGSGDLKHFKAGTQVDKIYSENQVMAYLTNYLKKLKQKTVPEEYLNIGRFWSHSSKVLNSLDYEIQHSDNKNNIRKLKKATRFLRRWYFSKMRKWGYKWKWKQQGFTAWDGMEFFKELEKRNLINDLIGF